MVHVQWSKCEISSQKRCPLTISLYINVLKIKLTIVTMKYKKTKKNQIQLSNEYYFVCFLATS